MSTVAEDKVKKLVDWVYNEVADDLSQGEFSMATVVIILPKLMHIIALKKDLDGPTKKNIVIGVIDRIIDDNVKHDPEGKMKDALLELTPAAIDTLYEVYSHRYVFKQKITGCFAKCKGSTK